MKKPVEQWEEDDSYKALSVILHGFYATNDAAERGVKFGSDYCNVLTKDPEQRQHIMQVVEQERNARPKATKK